jgi:hypothetical protein
LIYQDLTLLALAPAHQGLSSPAAHVGVAFVAFVVAAGAAAWSVWKDKLPKLRVWLILAAGVPVAAIAGGYAAMIAGTANTSAPIAAGMALGIAVIFAFELWYVAHPAGRGGRGGMRGGGGPGGPGPQTGGHERSRRIFHSAMALISPFAFLAAYGVLAVSLGQGVDAVTWVSASVLGVI